MILTKLFGSFDKKIELPYTIPNYILPEVMQWIANHIQFKNRLQMGIVEIDIHDDIKILSRLRSVNFRLESNDNEVIKEFNNYLNKNKFKFLLKRIRFYHCFVFSKQDFSDTHISFTNNISIQIAVEEFFAKILNLNYMLGEEKWCPGMSGFISSLDVFSHKRFSYLDDFWFFDEKDRNLYKLIK